MHNGFIAEFPTVKRDLVMAIDELLYSEIAVPADTEVLFYLALTFGLEVDPPGAVAPAIGLVEKVGAARGVKYPFQETIATTDGRRRCPTTRFPGETAGHGRGGRGLTHARASGPLRYARARTFGLDVLGVYDAVVRVVDDELARTVAGSDRVGGARRVVEVVVPVRAQAVWADHLPFAASVQQNPHGEMTVQRVGGCGSSGHCHSRCRWGWEGMKNAAASPISAMADSVNIAAT
jgi:hypothetical protein